MTDCILQLRVASIRSRKSHGVIFSAYSICDNGIADNRQIFVVRAVGKDYAHIQPGELWEAAGELTEQHITINGYTRTEYQINASELRLLKPSGNQIICWIEENNKIHGIGNVKAQKLWMHLGEDLYTALDAGDAKPLLSVINNPDIVHNLLDVWHEEGDTDTLKWMQDNRIPLALSRKVIRFHGRNTLPALKEDPYRLLSFCAAWNTVDHIAIDRLGLTHDDPRRLQAAAEQVLYDQMTKGHTCLDARTALECLVRLLKSKPLAEAAVQHADKNKVIKVIDGRLQTAGCWIMEQTVAHFIAESIKQPWQQPMLNASVDTLIDRFETSEAQALGVCDFRLNPGQRQAVKCSFQNGFSVITGGAGVGKTTVLKALYRLLDELGKPRFQMALSGRAAKRMSEATGERAYTIAAFLNNIRAADLGTNPVIIIDEASMVDLSSMYRLIRKLPPCCHMVLVGDAHQLPPVSSGLVLHCLMDVPGVPISELTEVKRQADDSYIPHFAHAVRSGVWPTELLAQNVEAHIQLVPCADRDVVNTVVALYLEDRANTQILTTTNANTFSGCQVINRECCYRLTANNGAKALRLYDENTGFYEGDLLLYTRNDWERDLQNGSLGQLLEVFNTPQFMTIGESGKEREVEALALATWEGRVLPVLERDIEALLHGYAVTVHKAQGSQFNRVIVPITAGRVDRTLIYTALTRAIDQIVIVGDLSVVQKAVASAPSATLRSVGLLNMLT